MGDPRFGARLKEIREDAGLSQAQLATKISSSLRTIGRLENGTVAATWPTILALCDALGVSCEDFKASDGDVPKPKMGRPKKKGSPDV